MEILDCALDLVFALCGHGGGAERAGWRAWTGTLGAIGVIVWWPEPRASAGILIMIGMIALAAGGTLTVVRRMDRPRGGSVAGLRLIPRRGSAR